MQATEARELAEAKKRRDYEAWDTKRKARSKSLEQAAKEWFESQRASILQAIGERASGGERSMYLETNVEDRSTLLMLVREYLVPLGYRVFFDRGLKIKW